MTTFFVDTSALGRRYLQEVGWQWTRRWLPKVAGHVIVIADITTVEIFSAFARLAREAKISTAQATALQNKYLFDLVHEYLSIPVDTDVMTMASGLVVKYPLRALDAVQLACARRARSMLGVVPTFVSGDARLLTAASGEGFTTDNPHLHP
jgi:hypothetical protein